MATLALFDDMLNEHLAYDLMMEELTERNWLIKNVQKNEKWKGGPLPVPFRGARGSSFSQGQLTAENDISDYQYVRGQVDDYKETWGTLKFNAKDLHQHVPEAARKKGLVNKDSFLRILPDQIEDFIDGMKDMVSTMLLNGGHFATLTANATANDGTIVVDRVERFEIGQKIVIDDDNSVAIECYVRSINVNTYTLVVYDARTGGAVIDFSGNNMTTAQNARVYIPGAEDSANSFTSLRSQLLSAANGGSSNLFGQSKLAYPYLQAINISGASVSATNILDQIFDGWTAILKLGKGHADRVVMSFKHIGSVFKLLEAGSGGFRHVETKASPYGYTEVTVGSVKGTLKLVAVQEMDDDVMYYLDMSAFKLHSNGFFERHIDPNGNGYYIKRATTGYVYITDIRFYGELILHAPCRCGVMHSIPAY
mgnify:CR=1 FL=1